MSRSVESVSRAGAVRSHPLGRAVLHLVAVGVVLLIVGLVLGLALVGRHGGGAIQGWDDTVWRWSIHHRGHLVGVDKVIAKVGDASWWGPICVVVSAVWFAIARSPRSLTPLLGFLGGEGLVFLIRVVMHRPRPRTATAPYALPGVHETSYSFPSGHAVAVTAVLFAVLGLVALARRTWWPWLLAFVASAYVADSRLLLGVHWFSDVSVGMLLGITWGVTVAVVCTRLTSLSWRAAEPAGHAAAHRPASGPDSA